MIACLCGGTLEALIFGSFALITWLLTRVRLWRAAPCSRKCCGHHGKRSGPSRATPELPVKPG